MNFRENEETPVPEPRNQRLLPWFIGAMAIVTFYTMLIAVTGATMNTDEALTGSAALRVLKGEWPIWIEHPMIDVNAGGAYLGALKAYLDAPLVKLFGPSDWSLRGSSLILRLLGCMAVFVILNMFFGRWVAAAGTIVSGLWTREMNFLITGGMLMGVSVFLWNVLFLLAALACRAPRRAVPIGIGMGLASGLALWNSPTSILMIVPAMTAYLLITAGVVSLPKRLLALFGMFVVGAFPWWYHNFFLTKLGSLAPTGVAGIASYSDLGTYLSSALDNCRYFYDDLLYLALSGYAYIGAEQVELRGRLLLHVYWAALVLLIPALIYRFGLPFRPLFRSLAASVGRGRLSDEDRYALFWWVAVFGCLCAYTVGVGFSAMGSTRGYRMQRYTMPFLTLVPFLLAPLAPRRWPSLNPLLGMAVGLFLVSMWFDEWVFRTRRVNMRAAELAGRSHTLSLIQRWRVSLLLGDWWTVGPYHFLSGGKVNWIALSPGLTHMFLPESLPRHGRTLLYLPRNAETDQIIAARGGTSDLYELPGEQTDTVRLYLVPENPKTGFGANLFEELRFHVRGRRFGRGEVDSLVLNPILSGIAEHIFDDNGRLNFRLAGSPGFQLWGPYVSLDPGRYEIEFRFPRQKAATRFVVGTDVVTQAGAVVLWQGGATLTATGGVVRGAFEVSENMQGCETRLILGEADGPVVVSAVVLRKLKPGP